MQCTIHVLTDLLRAFVQHMLFKKLCLSPVSNKINQVKSGLFLCKLHFGYTSGKVVHLLDYLWPRHQKDLLYVVLICKSIVKILWSYLLNHESSFFGFKNLHI